MQPCCSGSLQAYLYRPRTFQGHHPNWNSTSLLPAYISNPDVRCAGTATARAQRHSSTRPRAQVATPASSAPGPPGAFDAPTKAASRQKLFNDIAPVYDELNDVLSAGQHRVWKRMAVSWSGAAPGHAALDICCGSGDLARLLAHAVGPSGSVVGLDFAQEMLDYAAQARPPPRSCAVAWTQGDALDLKLPEASIDAATMGFGLRNVADIPQALREIHRVLKPGARAAILDFNNSHNPVVDSVQVRLRARVG